jgi:hypothetical protein
LRKSHDAKLLAAPKTANPNIAAIPRDDAVKTCPRHVIHDLREQRPTEIHGDASDPENRKTYRETADPNGEIVNCLPVVPGWNYMCGSTARATQS